MSQVNASEVRVLRSMCGVTRRDRVRNVIVRKRCGVAKGIVTRIESEILRWFGYVTSKGPSPIKSVKFSVYLIISIENSMFYKMYSIAITEFCFDFVLRRAHHFKRPVERFIQ